MANTKPTLEEIGRKYGYSANNSNNSKGSQNNSVPTLEEIGKKYGYSTNKSNNGEQSNSVPSLEEIGNKYVIKKPEKTQTPAYTPEQKIEYPTKLEYSTVVKYLKDNGVTGASGIMTKHEWARRKGKDGGTYEGYLRNKIYEAQTGNNINSLFYIPLSTPATQLKKQNVGPVYNPQMSVSSDEYAKKNANLEDLQNEIESLEDIEAKANQYERVIKNYTNKANTSKHRGNGLTASSAYDKKIKDTETEYKKFLLDNGFKDINDLKNKIAGKKQYKNSAKYIQDRVALENSIRAEDDFYEYVAKGEALGDEGKNLVAYYRKNPEKLEVVEPVWSHEQNEYSDKTVDEIIMARRFAEYGTKEQIEIYNAYLGKGDIENAKKYLEYVEESLNIAMGKEIAKEKDHTFEKITFGVAAGFDQFGQGFSNLFNTSDEYIPLSPTQVASGIVRESLKNSGPEILGSSLGQMGYDFINTTTNMLPSIGASYLSNAIVPGSGAFVGAALMGGSAAGNSYQEKLNAGWDKKQARIYSSIVGVSEACLQYALGGIGSLGSKLTGKSAQAIAKGIDNAALRFAATYGMKMTSEGLEESLQEVLNPFFENLALGYQKNDLSDVDWGQVAYSGMLGALSAGFLEGGSTAIDVFSENSSAKEIGPNLRKGGHTSRILEIASLSKEGSKTHELYSQYMKKGINAENISDLQLGRLFVNAEMDAKGTLSQRKIKPEQEKSARATLIELNSMRNKTYTPVEARTIDKASKQTAPTTLEQAAREVVESRNEESGKMNARTLDALTANNQPITAEEVKEVTRLGENGSKLIAEIANEDGITFSQAEAKVKGAYLEGLTNSENNGENISDPQQKMAFNAGRQDRIMQDAQRQAEAKNATVYDGTFHENEYTKKFSKAEKKMISTFAKILKMDIDTLDKIIANKTYDEFGNEIEHEANARHNDGKLTISNNRDALAVVYRMVLHESGHRMSQFATKEWGALMNALYQRAEQSGRKANLGVNNVSMFDMVKNQHDEAGISMETLSYIEEVAVRELETIFSSAKEFNKWYAEISANPELKGNWQKFCDWISQVIEDLKKAWSQRKMTAEEKAKANEAIAELERIKGFLAETMKASEKAATEIANNQAQDKQGVTKNKSDIENNKSFSLRNSKSGRANDLLLPYNAELTELINRRGDYIINNFDDLKNIVNLAFDNRQKQATAYFGSVPYEVLKKIEKSIPNLPKELNGTLFKTGKDYSVAATLDSIRHLADEKKLSREEIIDYLDRMADTIVEFDNVTFNYYYEKGNRMNGVLFKKEFNDGTIRSFEIASNKKRALNLQTIYLENGDYIKKKSAESTLMDNPSANVQDEDWSNFNNRLSQNSKSVKSDFSLKDSDYLKAVETGDKADTDGNASFSLKNKNLTINSRIPFVELKNYTNVAKNDNTALNTLETKIKNLKRGTYQNDATGYRADITRETIDKAIKPTHNKFDKFDKKHICNLNAMLKLPELFKNAVYVDSKPPQKAKNQNKAIKEYHHFVAPVFMDSGEYRALITAREKANSNTLYVIRVEVLPTQKRHTPVAAQQNNAVGSQWLSVPSDISIAELVNGVKIKNYDTNTNDIYSAKDIQFSLKTHDNRAPSEIMTEFLDVVEDLENGKKNAVSKLSKYVDNGMITTKYYDELIEQYGAIPSGERPHRDVQVPRNSADGKKVSQTVRTILEAKATPDEVVPTIEKMVEDGAFSYDAYTDKQAIEEAEAYLKENGWVDSLKDWFNSVGKGVVSKQHTAMGWALYNNSANLAKTTTSETEKKTAIETSLNILDAMVKHQRSAAQALQATRILKKLSPETQLYGVQKSVQAFQKELIDKYGKRAPNLKINEELAEKFLTAETQEERLDAEIEIYKDIGRQVPSNWLDKWNAVRYIGMLANLRTHGRNILGNAFFAPVVITKNLTATAIEAIVYRISGKKTVRGKALVWGSKADRGLLNAAWNDYANVTDLVSNGGKYNEFSMGNKYIEEGRKIFGFKATEWVRKTNSEVLEKEDVWFSKPHYAYALAQYCKANNITAEQIERGRAIEPARVYAIKEAQKATYKDTNAFSQWVSGLGRNGKKNKNLLEKGVGVVVEGVLPFRKTPANILARGVEYSPLGLLKGLSYDLVQVSKGKMSATEAIDNISAGLTGTGLLAFGVLLAAQGLIRGHGEDDKKEKEFKELMGHQAYSLELPNGTSVTLDWLAPEALPFFVGVNIWEATRAKGEEVNFSTILKAVSNITEPLLEMSCLQGLNGLIEGIKYASENDTSALMAVLIGATTSYLTQVVPTFLGQVERTGEENRMTTYTEKDAFLTKDMQYTLGKISSKIPFWDYNQIPYIDAWGRKEASGTALKRGFNNFLNPAYTSTIDTSNMEKELLRLYEKTGEDAVFPSRANKYFTVNGVRKDLTADEYVKYATLKGQKSYKLISDLIKNKAYKTLGDGEKVKAIDEAYAYADQKAKQAISNYKPDTWVKKADEFGLNVGNYISFRAEVSNAKKENGDKISKEEVVDIILDMAQNDSETWKMYLSMYDSDRDKYAYEKGIQGHDYMNFITTLNKYDKPTKAGKYGTYTQEEAYYAIKSLNGLSRQEKAVLWQSVNSSWKTSNNPFR